MKISFKNCNLCFSNGRDCWKNDPRPVDVTGGENKYWRKNPNIVSARSIKAIIIDNNVDSRVIYNGIVTS